MIWIRRISTLIALLGCDGNVRYNARDVAFLKKFLRQGGCVLIAGNAGTKGQNLLLSNSAPGLKESRAPLFPDFRCGRFFRRCRKQRERAGAETGRKVGDPRAGFPRRPP